MNIENILKNRMSVINSLDLAGFAGPTELSPVNRCDNYVQDYNKKRVFLFKELMSENKVTFFV